MTWLAVADFDFATDTPWVNRATLGVPPSNDGMLVHDLYGLVFPSHAPASTLQVPIATLHSPELRCEVATQSSTMDRRRTLVYVPFALDVHVTTDGYVTALVRASDGAWHAYRADLRLFGPASDPTSACVWVALEVSPGGDVSLSVSTDNVAWRTWRGLAPAGALDTVGPAVYLANNPNVDMGPTAGRPTGGVVSAKVELRPAIPPIKDLGDMDASTLASSVDAAAVAMADGTPEQVAQAAGDGRQRHAARLHAVASILSAPQARRAVQALVARGDPQGAALIAQRLVAGMGPADKRRTRADLEALLGGGAG